MSTKGKISRMREIFAILTTGIELNEYEVNEKTGKTEITQKVMWIETEIYRLCCDVARPSIAERTAGFVPRGIYLRDISEIRDGADAYPFTRDKSPRDPDCCLSIIGTECTLSLELPSPYTKDWFISRFRLITENLQTDEERRQRRFKTWESPKLLGDSDSRSVRNIEGLLERGIEMEHHDRNGEKEKVMLHYRKETGCISIRKKTKKYFGFIPMSKEVELKMRVSDISEIRPGSHSMSFVLSRSTEFDPMNMSIVASENCFDMKLVSNKARDLFVEQMFLFACKHKAQDSRETGSDDSLQSSETGVSDTLTRNTAQDSYSHSV